MPKELWKKPGFSWTTVGVASSDADGQGLLPLDHFGTTLMVIDPICVICVIWLIVVQTFWGMVKWLN